MLLWKKDKAPQVPIKYIVLMRRCSHYLGISVRLNVAMYDKYRFNVGHVNPVVRAMEQARLQWTLARYMILDACGRTTGRELCEYRTTRRIGPFLRHVETANKAVQHWYPSLRFSLTSIVFPFENNMETRVAYSKTSGLSS